MQSRERFLAAGSAVATESIAPRAHSTRAAEQNDGISIKLSALHPRYEDSQRERVLDVPLHLPPRARVEEAAERDARREARRSVRHRRASVVSFRRFVSQRSRGHGRMAVV